MQDTSEHAQAEPAPSPGSTAGPSTDRRLERACDLVALACVVGTFALAVSVTQGAWFYVDEWAFAPRGLTPVDILRPYNGHLSVGILATYRLHFAVFGFDGYVVLRVLAYGLLAAVPGALYLTTKARWGPPAAAAAAAATAWTRFPGLDPASMNHWTTLVAGIVGAWALPRTGRRADLVVGLALVAGFLSAGGAVVFALAFAVHTVLTRAERGRWVAVGLPSLGWLTWYAVVGRTQGRIPAYARLTPAELLELPFRGVAATFEGLAFGSAVLGVVLGVAYLALLVPRLRAGRAAVATAVGYGLATVAWWLSLGQSRGFLADPAVFRYRAVTVVLLVLAVVPGERTTGRRPAPLAALAGRAPRLAPALAATVVAVALAVANAPTFRDQGDSLVLSATTTHRQADIRATEVGRVPASDQYQWLMGGLTPDELDAAYDRYGYDRPATVEDLDLALLDRGGVSAIEGPAPDRPCTVLDGPVANAQDDLVLFAGDEPVTVEVRRFGDAWVPFEDLAAGRSLRMRFALDSSDQPWQVRAEGGCY